MCQLCVSPWKSSSSVRCIHHLQQHMVVMPSIKGPLKKGLVRWENRIRAAEAATGPYVSAISYSRVNDLVFDAPGDREMTITAFNTPRGMVWKQES